MIDCNYNICIGKEDIKGESVCPYVGEKEKEGIVPMFIRKDDSSKPTAEEIKALYNRVNKEYGN